MGAVNGSPRGKGDICTEVVSEGKVDFEKLRATRGEIVDARPAIDRRMEQEDAMDQTGDRQDREPLAEGPDASILPDSAGGQILIYQDGALHLQVRLDGQTVWLTQKQLADLYQTTVPNISQHLRAIYDEGELAAEATIKQYLIVQTEGRRQVRRQVGHYSMDVILAVGYRVQSARGTQFRQWATSRLRELLVKGFVPDDERIKAGRTIGQDYFDELLARIRE